MKRRDFIAYVTTATGLLPITITQMACSNGYGPTSSSSSSDSYSFTTTPDSTGHSHTVEIKIVDVTSPPASGRSLTTSGPSHTHTVELTQADLVAIAAGEEITRGTSTDSGHAHTFTFKVATTSGNTGGDVTY